MNLPVNSLERIVKRTALLIAALVALSIPASYAYVAYQELTDILTFKAQVKANAVNELIAQMPNNWMYAENRLQGLLSHVPVYLENEHIQLFDKNGKLLTQVGETLSGPVISARFPVSDSGVTAGSLVIATSLDCYLFGVALSILLALLLAYLTYYAMKTLPLRALRRASEDLFMEKERAETTLHSIADAVITTDIDCRINYINPAAQRILGCSLNEVYRKPIADVLKLFEGNSHERIKCPLENALKEDMLYSTEGENTLERQNGTRVEIEESYAPLHDRDGMVSGGVVVLRDVSFAQSFIKQQTWEATHDSLTGLKNRRELEKCVLKALMHTKQTGASYVLCYMDLDRFKLVNDSSGHAAGDQLLIKIAEMMLQSIRKTDCLARVGSDEFGLLLENCNTEVGFRIATDLKATIDNFVFTWSTKQHQIGVSIGLTQITPEHNHVAEIIGEADNACYWSKEHGLNQVTISASNNPGLTARRSEISWVTRINKAFREKRFVLYQQVYQTLNTHLDLKDHIEVLIRMVGEEGEIIPPGHFLPAAERYAMMPEIDRWVIEQVFSQYKSLVAARNGKPAIYCINLSGASINAGGFIDYIREQAHKFGMEPDSICFELTETVAVNNMQAARNFIHECKNMGFSFALDDFGSGTSSFGYLKALPVDYLKIDGSFVKDMEHDRIDQAMVETINRIGHLLGKFTIAEFVENSATAKMLSDIGVDFAQGYGISRPAPLLT